MSDLVLPGGMAPSNLHLLPGQSSAFVEGDVYNICERVKEVDRSLQVVQRADPEYPYAVMEFCGDGVERLVFKVKELDGRIIERLQYLMNVPLHQRLKELEADEYKWEAQRKSDELDELYERIGRPMWTQLDHDGFVPGGRGVSFAKRGVKR